MKSLVLQNIDADRLYEQKEQLVDLVAQMDFYGYQGLTELREIVVAQIRLLESVTNADTEQKTLEDHELGYMVQVLEEVAEHHRFNDFTTEDEDKALEATIAFLKGDKVPRE